MNTPGRKKRRDAGKKKNAYGDVHLSVRLNPGKDPDRRVIQILTDWMAKVDDDGKYLTLKHVFCMGILALEGEREETGDPMEDLLTVFGERLDKMMDIIERLEEVGVSTAPKGRKRKNDEPAIDMGYLANLRKAMRSSDE